MKQKVTVNFPKLIEYLSEATRCPPLVYALKVLYENSSLSVSCWVSVIILYVNVTFLLKVVIINLHVRTVVILI